MNVEPTSAFCSARNRYVPVVITARPDPDAVPSHRDPQGIVCLDYRVRCNGAMCPMFTCLDEYPEELRASLPPAII